MSFVFLGLKSSASLDFVTAWYRKSVDFMKSNDLIQTAFVSTNSITQGEQVSLLWPDLLSRGIVINFAHRTFQWNNEAKGNAAVHCVIIGFGLKTAKQKIIFDYENIKSDPHTIQAKNINPYLTDALNIIVSTRSKPICNVQEMINGSKPTDGGNLLLSSVEKERILNIEPNAEKYIKSYVGSEEFINNIPRYCLWLVECTPDELRAMPAVLEKVNLVREMRLKSDDVNTRKDAAKPMLFQKIRQPKSNYLIIPRVSSENRQYVPIKFATPDLIVGDAVQTIPDASLYDFGVLTSTMHNSWMRSIAGRLKSDYRYSAGIVYNNFPWPENPSEKQKAAIEAAAQAVLDARTQFPDSTLADLYDPLTMPPVLLKAHQTLDKAVDAAYGKTSFKTEAERVAFLFGLYQGLLAKLH